MNFKFKHNILAMLLCAAMSVSLFSCTSQKATSTSVNSQSADASLSTQKQEFPLTVTDAAGREVTINAEPKTIVSGYYITSSMLIALGQKDKLVGIEAKAEKRPIYALSAAELLKLPSVGTAKEFDLEGCAALKPELVILPLKLKDAALTLEELGIPALVVNPESMDMMEQTIEMLGKATGAVQKADELLSYNSQTKKELNDTLADTEKPRVYLAGNSNYLSTAGAKMYQNTLIELGGGENVANELTDTYWAEVSYEQLLAWNPDIILIAAEADYTKQDIINDTQLSQLDAVKNNKIYAMPSAFEAWDSPIPGAMLGSRWIASVLHEEQYPFSLFKQDVADFYSTFYNFEVDEALITQ